MGFYRDLPAAVALLEEAITAPWSVRWYDYTPSVTDLLEGGLPAGMVDYCDQNSPLMERGDEIDVQTITLLVDFLVPVMDGDYHAADEQVRDIFGVTEEAIRHAGYLGGLVESCAIQGSAIEPFAVTFVEATGVLARYGWVRLQVRKAF